MLLRRELWRMGLGYRKNVISLPGKPDIVFASAKVAVFCDGDFWHGRNWPELSAKLLEGSNADYWQAKIRSNMDRDQRNTALLEGDGWLVIRLWETDIKKDVAGTAHRIARIVEQRRMRVDKQSERQLATESGSTYGVS
jgi:DNA mismatch endonuclease (patch repair protein)